MDAAIFHLINEQWTTPVLDLFMAIMSDSEIWKPFLILVAVAAAIFGGFKARTCLICILFILLIAEQVTGALKTAVDRRRPKQIESVRMFQFVKARPAFLKAFQIKRIGIRRARALLFRPGIRQTIP
jgi:hypothetical protein